MSCQAHKWVDNAFAKLNLEVDMGELCQAGHADEPQFLARFDHLLRFDQETASFQMSVDGAPTTAMVDDNEVTVAVFRDRVVAYEANVNVWHAIASILDCSWGGGDYSDTVSELRVA